MKSPLRRSLPLASLATLLLAAPVPAAAGDRAETISGNQGSFKPGSRSLHDDLFPQIGNGGYDAERYSIQLRYDPRKNQLEHGTKTTMTARATQDLGSFTLDFQDLRVNRVQVNGEPASFLQVKARPKLSNNPEVTQPRKLVVEPARGIREGGRFEVKVSYEGVPEAIVDTDESLEGWAQACSPKGCDGSFVVNEPIGAQSWFPSNNYMTDKATFETSITVPSSHTALGVGELRSRKRNRRSGTTTWRWVENNPTATYLTSATVGRFDLTSAEAELAEGRTVPVYTAIDSAGSAARKQAIRGEAARIPEITNFLTELFGPYPFDSTGLVADWAPNVGYALENQTKPHFAGDSKGPAVDTNTLTHEIAHQWMGNSVSPATWHEIWFGEGWATFSEVLFDARVEGGKSLETFFDQVYAVPEDEWALAPASLGGNPANLFAKFAVYERPGAMIEGYRQIAGDERFAAFARALVERHGYATITEEQFTVAALEFSGLAGADLERLGSYFRQWLHATTRPALTPADFPTP